MASAPKKKAESEEKPVDYMKDSKERPYGEAITDEHRAFLASKGIVVEEPKKK